MYIYHDVHGLYTQGQVKMTGNMVYLESGCTSAMMYMVCTPRDR